VFKPLRRRSRISTLASARLTSSRALWKAVRQNFSSRPLLSVATTACGAVGCADEAGAFEEGVCMGVVIVPRLVTTTLLFDACCRSRSFRATSARDWLKPSRANVRTSKASIPFFIAPAFVLVGPGAAPVQGGLLSNLLRQHYRFPRVCLCIPRA